MIVLKDLEDVLQGSVKFKVQRRNFDKNIETVDEILPYEIKYLPANLSTSEILRIDLDEKVIFLKNNNSEDWFRSKLNDNIEENLDEELQSTMIKNSIDDNNLI